MGFSVRCSTTLKIKGEDKLFTSEEQFPTYEEAYAYYKDSSRRLAERATRTIKVELFNPYKVSLISSYIAPKKPDTLAPKIARMSKEPRALQKLKVNEVKALLLLFKVIEKIISDMEFNATTTAAFKRMFDFMDALAPKLNKAIDNITNWKKC